MPTEPIDIHDLPGQLGALLSLVQTGTVVTLKDGAEKVARVVPMWSGEMPERITDSIETFVEKLDNIHEENSEVQHFMRKPNGVKKLTMFLTPFAYEFFLYNSLYQIDWSKSLKEGRIEVHTPDTFDKEEKVQQSIFEDFLREYSMAYPELINTAFARLSNTRLGEDARISLDKSKGGPKFYGDLNQLQERLKRFSKMNTPELHKDVFDYVGRCRPFVYKVRCNIFHGRKTIAEAYEPGQNQRIEVYYYFLNSLVSLFFGIMREELPAARKPPQRVPRTAGLHPAAITVSPDFDEPIIAEFQGE
jgi:hypothetical protein